MEDGHVGGWTTQIILQVWLESMALHTLIDDSDEEFLYISIFNLHCVICPSLYRTVFLLQTRNCLGHNKSPAFTFLSPNIPPPKTPQPWWFLTATNLKHSSHQKKFLSPPWGSNFYSRRNRVQWLFALWTLDSSRGHPLHGHLAGLHMCHWAKKGAFRTVEWMWRVEFEGKTQGKPMGFLKFGWKVILLLGQVHRVLNPCSNQFT